MVALVQELRRKAAFCRRAASISTSGSGRTDRILLALAERLERGAALRERQLQDGTVPRTKSGQQENLGGSRRGGLAAADPARHGGAGARHQADPRMIGATTRGPRRGVYESGELV